MHEHDLWLRLVYRGLIRVERKMDRVIEALEEQGELLELSRTLKESTDPLKKALHDQGTISPGK